MLLVVLMILTFAPDLADMGCKCQNRTTSRHGSCARRTASVSVSGRFSTPEISQRLREPAAFDYGPEQRIDQMIAFIEAMGLGPLDIVGNSMGGRTALATAIRRPDLVGDLILMGSAGLDRSMGGALAALTEYDFTYRGMERIVIALTNDGHVPDPAMVQYRLELSCQPGQRSAFGATMKALQLRHGLWIEDEEIATVKHRTLIINGKHDKIIPIAHAYKYLELLENSTGVILPHCWHWAMIEHPEIFSNTVLQFLNGQV